MHIIPQLRDLQALYPNSLVIIGVHSPKFANEQVDSNVREAILRYKIEHPVVNDAQLSLWRTLGVQAWPTVVLVDPEGNVATFVAGENVEPYMAPYLARMAATYKAAGTLDERPLSLALESARQPASYLSFPGKVLYDSASRRLFVSDSGHDRIVVMGLDGATSATIGSGHPGRADGAFERAAFRNPQGMALVGSVLYVADTDNHLIRGIDLQKKVVTTVAGTGRAEAIPSTGGPALTTSISSPWDVCWLRGQLYIAMAGDHRIWRYDPARQSVRPFAGTGNEGRRDGSLEAAWFAQPSGLATDGRYLYVADSESSSIRSVDPTAGTVSTLAGGDLFDFGHRDGRGVAARFQHPLGLSYADGKLFIADTYNSDIRALDLKTRDVSTLAGTNNPGFLDGTAGRFFEPGGVAYGNATLYVADTDNGAIRTLDPAARDVQTLHVAPPATGAQSAVDVHTGISGRVSIGPITPVSREGVPNEKPYPSTVEVRRADGTLAASVKTRDDGTYAVTVAPGDYKVSVASTGKVFPRVPIVDVSVLDQKVTTADQHVDTGIR